MNIFMKQKNILIKMDNLLFKNKFIFIKKHYFYVNNIKTKKINKLKNMILKLYR